VLLWDGAPVRFKEFHGQRVPTFPLLKILARGGYRSYRFRAEQKDVGLVAALEEALPRGTQLYVHDEEVAWLCHQFGRRSGRLAVPALHRDDGALAAAARQEALWVQLRPEGRV